MLRLTKKDWLTIAGVAALLAVLIVGARDKIPQAPRDGRHSSFYEAVESGRDRAVVERGCAACHNPRSRPFRPGHPPKEQCMLCHKLGFKRA